MGILVVPLLLATVWLFFQRKRSRGYKLAFVVLAVLTVLSVALLASMFIWTDYFFPIG